MRLFTSSVVTILAVVAGPLAADPPAANRAAGALAPALLGQETPVVTSTPPTPSPGTPPPPAPAELPPPTLSTKTIEFLNSTTFSGYVSTSFFYNFNNPSDDLNTGRAFDNKSDEFTFNKLHLTLDNPVEYSGEKWDAGFHTDVIFGEDATLLQSAGLALGAQGDLETAYLTINAPIGAGLKLSAGKFATYMGVDVIEEILNPNLSTGNQFLFAENFTHLGAEAAYKFGDLFEAKARITNGWDVVKDNNNAKSYMAALNFTPCAETLISIVPYVGPEQSQAATTGSSGAWRKGVSVVLAQQLGAGFKTWVQLDYGHEDKSTALPDPTNDAKWYAAGLWLAYDVKDDLGLAVRADYFNDPDGARTSAAPFTAPFPSNTGQELYSLTGTVNFKPLPSVQIRPEIRWDHSSLDNAFDGSDDQVTVGCGVAYIF